MRDEGTARTRWPRALTLVAPVAAFALGACLPSSASDGELERAQLALLLRELNMLERIASEAQAQSSTNGGRYRFDYARLSADLARVRAGVAHYLTPSRAQPRDPALLHGDYRRERSESP